MKSAQGELYAQYRDWIEGEPLARSLRVAVFVFFAIQTVFIGVDWLIFPESFAKFLPVRLALNVTFAGIYFLASRAFPFASTVATCWLGGAMLQMVVSGTGGGSSGYYVGIVLLFVGVGTLVPVRGRQAAGILAVLYAGYALAPFLLDEQIEWRTFSLHLFFLGGAGFAGVASSTILDRMRFADFCQRKDLERARDELRELDRAKGRFTANIHHELRTPLTLMLAPLAAMQSGEFGDVPQPMDRMLRTMHANGLRLLKLINNLLDLAKIESQQLRVKRAPIRLSSLVEELVEGARAMAEQKGLVLSTHGFEHLPMISADPGALEKVMINLVGNSLKFTERGGIDISARVLTETQLVEIGVQDTGAGIPSEDLDRVFDRFAQVDASTTRTHEGTGIGLSLVKELVELHGGRVWAESKGLGYGTKMIVTLPIGAIDGELGEEAQLSGAEQGFSAAHSIQAFAAEMGTEGVEPDGHARDAADLGMVSQDDLPNHGAETPEVVIAEDNNDMRRLLAFLIGRHFRVRVGRNGREALALVRERHPHLIVTDVMMPEMSGIELCRAIKNDPETQAVPVMLVTSKAEREMKIEGLELGADDYVTKPFHPRELLARVRSLVRVRDLQRSMVAKNLELEVSNEKLELALRELKEAEVQLVQAERLAAVGELSAGVAHEVNNPLNFARNSLVTLSAYVDDLRGLIKRVASLDVASAAQLSTQLRDLELEKKRIGIDELADDLTELVAIVTEGLDRTAALVTELRDFAAPQRGQKGLVDVEAGLSSTLHLLSHVIRNDGARLDAEISPNLPKVLGDGGALNQVFLNLIKNAAEALEGSAGVIRVAAHAESGRVVIRVQDDGVGMSAEIMDRLFEPFFTTKEAGHGTGLGLSMCRRILDEHSGNLRFESTQGEGTTALLDLPIAESTEQSADGA